MKTKKMRNWVTLAASAVFLPLAVMFISSCNKDNKVEQLATNISTGSDIIDFSTGNSEWAMDKHHSNVGWETYYYGDNAFLTGRFNMFDCKMYFDQANPENTVIHGWVQLSTFNTGEPGRDGAGKCGPGYIGVQWDIDTVPDPDVYTPVASTDTAWFNSTSVERFGDGYVAHGNLKFRGIENPVDLYFQYLGIHEYPSTSGGASTFRSSFTGQFDMLANSVYGVNSTSIADLVTVKVNMEAKK